jgi:hypothetical protein
MFFFYSECVRTKNDNGRIESSSNHWFEVPAERFVTPVFGQRAADQSQQAGAGILRRFLPVQVGRPKQPLPSFF